MAFEDDEQQGNPYLALIEREQAEEAERVRQNTHPAGVTPDSRAKALTLAEELGLDVDVVERDPAAAQQLQERSRNPYLELMRNERVREFLATSPAAAAAQDDLPALVTLDNRLTWGATILRGWDNLQGLVGRYAEARGELAKKHGNLDVLGAMGLADPLIAWGRSVAEHNEQQSRDLGYTSTGADALKGPWELAQWVKEQFGTNLPTMGPIVAGGVAGGLVGGPLGAIIGAGIPAFAIGVGEVQSTVKEYDTTATAPELVFVGGTAIAALDAIMPAGQLGSRLVRTFGGEAAEAIAKRALTQPVPPRFFRRAAKDGAVEMSTEAVTEALQEAIGQVTGAVGADHAIEWGQIARQSLEAGASGGVVGGGFSAAGSIVAHPRERARYAASQQGKAFFQALGQDVEASKLYARLPGRVAEFVARVTKDGPVETVYAPTNKWEEYWLQQGSDPSVMAAELTGKADALAHAKQTGSDLAIPLATYAEKLAATDHNAFFQDNLRLGRADAMTFQEGRDFAQAFQQAVESIGTDAAPAADVDPTLQKAAAIGSRIYQQAAAAGHTDRRGHSRQPRHSRRDCGAARHPAQRAPGRDRGGLRARRPGAGPVGRCGLHRPRDPDPHRDARGGRPRAAGKRPRRRPARAHRRHGRARRRSVGQRPRRDRAAARGGGQEGHSRQGHARREENLLERRRRPGPHR
jgi:hypothetical protein